MRFEGIYPADMDLKDVKLLEAAGGADGIDSSLLVAAALEMKAQIWRLDNNGHRGIFVTVVKESLDGKRELFVWLMAGEGLRLESMRALHVLQKIARTLKCSKISCLVKNPTILKWYKKKLGFVEDGTRLSLEVA